MNQYHSRLNFRAPIIRLSGPGLNIHPTMRFFSGLGHKNVVFLTEIQLQLTLTRKTKDGELMKFLRQLFSMNTISSERQGSQQSSNSCPSKRTKYLQSYFTTTHTTKIKRCCVCLLINIPSIFRCRNKNFAKDDSSEFDCV